MNIEGYTAIRALEAEGARIGLVTCLQCGATVTIDPSDEQSMIGLHDAWHNESKSSSQTVETSDSTSGSTD